MFNMSNFNTCKGKISPNHVDSPDNLNIPKEMNIFQRTESEFLPDGKKFEDLTEEELNQLKQQYKYDYYRPGVYQAITGLGNMM